MERRVAPLADASKVRIHAGTLIPDAGIAVKELVENAIDAGASHVQVAVSGPGLRDVAVSDNGSGISREDVPLVGMPGCTSRPEHGAYGGRGESLGAIAAHARQVLITTRHSADPGSTAFRVPLDGELPPCGSDGSARRGTRVEVTGLFHTLPVRAMHCSEKPKEKAQWAHIVRTCLGLLMAHPRLSITLRKDGDVCQDLARVLKPCDTRAEAVREVVGGSAFRRMRRVAGAERGQEVEAFVPAPGGDGKALSRSHSDRIWCFVNDRLVRWRAGAGAVRSVWQTHQEARSSRYPVAVVFVRVPPALAAPVCPIKSDVSLTLETDETCAAAGRLVQLLKRTLEDGLGPPSQRPPPHSSAFGSLLGSPPRSQQSDGGSAGGASGSREPETPASSVLTSGCGVPPASPPASLQPVVLSFPSTDLTPPPQRTPARDCGSSDSDAEDEDIFGPPRAAVQPPCGERPPAEQPQRQQAAQPAAPAEQPQRQRGVVQPPAAAAAAAAARVLQSPPPAAMVLAGALPAPRSVRRQPASDRTAAERTQHTASQLPQSWRSPAASQAAAAPSSHAAAVAPVTPVVPVPAAGRVSPAGGATRRSPVSAGQLTPDAASTPGAARLHSPAATGDRGAEQRPAALLTPAPSERPSVTVGGASPALAGSETQTPGCRSQPSADSPSPKRRRVVGSQQASQRRQSPIRADPRSLHDALTSGVMRRAVSRWCGVVLGGGAAGGEAVMGPAEARGVGAAQHVGDFRGLGVYHEGSDAEWIVAASRGPPAQRVDLFRWP